MTETAINITLKSRLDSLRKSNTSASFKYNVPLYVYDIGDSEEGIKNSAVYFNSIQEASLALDINATSISQYRDTSVPYRGKLIYTKPIVDFDKEFEAATRNRPQGLLNKVTPIKIWVYDANTLKLIEGSPYDSKNKASLALGISRGVIDYFLDKDKAEGVKGNYLYSRPLNDKEIKNLLKNSKNLELGNKRAVYVYNAYTLDLINNNSPFNSIKEAADYFKVNYRTISRHLDTKLATMQDKMLVYFFKQELDSELKDKLIQGKLPKAEYIRSEIWVYKVEANGKLTLIPNQPFKTKREAIKIIGIHIKELNKYLDTEVSYKNLMFYTYPKN